MNYNEVKQKFLEFFLKNAKEKNIVKALEKEFYIMPDLLLGNMDISSKYKSQSFINSLYLKDIKKIIELTKNEDIFLVFMKGLFYAADLYDDYNYRLTSDLDVLTRKEDVYKLDNCLRSIGYKYHGHADLIKEIEIGHLKYVKQIGVFGKLLIEVHGSICNPAKYYKEYTEQVLENSDYQKLLFLKPRMESPQDRIIHSCLHFFAHAKEMYSYRLLKLPPRIKWQTLLDIVLLINKYGLNVDYLYEIARTNHCGLDLFFTFKMINRIINGFINDEILLQLKDIGLESEAMENETYKQLIIDNLEGKRKDEKILNSIKFKYDNVLNLSNYYQRITSYNSDSFKVNIDAKVTENKFVFLVDFENVDLEYSSIIIHYTSINKDTEDIALEKIVCSFDKDHNGFLPVVKMPYNKNYSNEIEASRIIENGKISYCFATKKENLIEALCNTSNNIISYSIHLEGKNVCLTGNSWNDFETMKHIKMEI